ncbi:MAG TPA: OmpH family outer membrane protein [Verrucomicrobiae bacterium]|jgi:outer membrane protein
MKIILRIILPTILLLTFFSSSALAQQKIATVDVQKLFNGYWKKKQAEVALNDRKAELEKEDRGFIDDLKKSKDDYQKLLDGANDQAVSDDERARRKQAADDKAKQIQDSQQTIVQFERQAQATLAEQSQRMRENILKEIEAAVAIKAKAGHYTLVIDSAAQTVNQTPVFLYNEGQDDLTTDVLNQLNAGAPVDTTIPSATSPPPLGIGSP